MQQEGRIVFNNPLGGSTDAFRPGARPGAAGGFRDDKDQESIELLRRFITDYRTSSNETLYRDALRRNYNLKHYFLEVNLAHVSAFNDTLANELVHRPIKWLDLFEEAAKRAVRTTMAAADRNAGDEVHDIQIQLISDHNTMPIRDLQAAHVSKLVRVPGIVISSSRVQARSTKLGIECRSCHHFQHLAVASGFGGAELPKTCSGYEQRVQDDPNTAKCPMNPYVVVPDKSQYVDQQILKLQESPETIPTGEMPRHVTVVIDRSLVGRAVPGTRVVVTGISQIYQSASAKTMGDAAVRHPYLKVVGLEISSEGAGRVASQFSQEEVTMFKAVARRPDVYDVLSKSIAPAVWGHDDIKKAVACQLFGGCRKSLPDGMRLRGDINILLLGDPGTAKSQMLKFVEKVAPIGVYTSGKGSSAAGLTASVVRDPASKEFYLEGGAMVLADGGIVCIDEFDKMRAQDRVAIHEAMEQQTISIAKAGITTILNARSAVLAAANPSFGVYDELRSAEENMTEFRQTILSRFDCIFLIKDTRDEKRDRTIAQHVVNVHMRHHRSNRGGDEDDGSSSSGYSEIDTRALKRYIQYCRETCHPRLTESASQMLTNHYVSVRKAYRTRERSGEGNAIPITVRQLEAIIRLAEALAKMSLSPKATEDNVKEAIRLFTVSTVEATNTGKVVLEQMPDNIRSEVEAAEVLIKKKIAIDSSTRLKNLILSLTKPFNLSETAVRKAIMIMVQKDELELRSRRQLVYRKR